MFDITLPSSDGAGFLTLANFRSDHRGGASFEIVVSTHGFAGRTEYGLEPQELRSLINALRAMYETCSGFAELRLHREEEHVAFQMTAVGRVVVTGLLVHGHEPQQRLKFAFYSDQSCLPDFIRALAYDEPMAAS
jgi:hypothetical protein